MTLTEPKPRSPWSTACFAWGIVVVSWTILLIVQVSQGHAFVPQWAIPAVGFPVETVAVTLYVMRRGEKRRVDAALEAAKAEAKALRTPRAPDAGPDQCPVCGGFGLGELAADDKLMERGADRAKVVPWGPKRAHWDCAEFVPHKAPGQPPSASRAVREQPSLITGSGYVFTGQHIGAYWTCRYCKERKAAFGTQAAETALRKHAQTCAVRLEELRLSDQGAPTSGKLRASIGADTIAALFAEVNDRPKHMSTESGWLIRDKGWRK